MNMRSDAKELNELSDLDLEAVASGKASYAGVKVAAGQTLTWRGRLQSWGGEYLRRADDVRGWVQRY
jgi:hypothetical protein